MKSDLPGRIAENLVEGWGVAPPLSPTTRRRKRAVGERGVEHKCVVAEGGAGLQAKQKVVLPPLDHHAPAPASGGQ